MIENDNQDIPTAASTATQPTIVVGGDRGGHSQAGAAVLPVPRRHYVAEAYVDIALMTLVLFGVILPILVAVVFVYLGAVPVGVLALLNVIIVPILLMKRWLTGVHKVLGIVLLCLSALAVAAGIFWLASVHSIVSNSDKRSQQMSQYYTQQEATARSEATAAQATQLLNSCQIFGFYYTHQDGTDGNENAEKTSTGILLYKIPKSFDGTTTPGSSAGGKYRMHIADRMISTMVPIARNAQHSCGIQFWHDGNYEQWKGGHWYFNGQLAV